MVNDGNDGAFIVWHDFRSFTDYDVYIQHINAAGVVTWTANGIKVVNNPDHQTWPDVVNDGNGGAIVAWIDQRSGLREIYIQRFDAAGNALWNSNGLPVSVGGGNKTTLKMTKCDNGDVAIAWIDSRNSDYNIYAQRLDINGNILWTANGVQVCAQPVFFSLTSPPGIVSDQNNGLLISWDDTRSGFGVYMQRLLSDGTVSWTTDGIAVTNTTALGQNMTADGNGGAVVLWKDSRPGTPGLYAQKIDGSGNLLWTASGAAICTFSSGQNKAKICNDGNNGCIATWIETRWNGSQWKDVLLTQRINASGIKQWTTDGIWVDEDFSQYDFPQIIKDGSGGAIIAYAKNVAGENDIYAQHLSSAGALLWNAGGRIVSNAANYQSDPMIINISNGNSIVAWLDYRNGSQPGIFTSRILSNGALPVTLTEFYGQKHGSANDLYWSTAYEQSNRGFDIERSADGMHFQSIGSIAGQINSNSLQHYSFSDQQPFAGKNYYRLKQSDQDNRIQYSKIILLQNNVIDRLTVFPIPANNFITIQSSAENPINITDATGRKIKAIYKPANSISLDISKWPSGIYYCVCGNETVRFVKSD